LQNLKTLYCGLYIENRKIKDYYYHTYPTHVAFGFFCYDSIKEETMISNQNEPGMVVILKALRELVDSVPDEGQKIDWSSLKRKKEIGKKAMDKLEEVFSKEPLSKEIIDCVHGFPKIFY